MRKALYALLIVMLLVGCDNEPPLADSDLVQCDFDLMLNNKVVGQSAQEMVDECNTLASFLGKQPTYRLLRETGITNSAFQLKGYKHTVIYTTEKLLQITDMRGQLHSGDDAIINNYNIVFKMYNAWNGDVTPDSVSEFLSHYGPLSKKLSDKGFVGMMATVRMMNQ